ncbi:preprotein translocase YidC [Spirilliplanes yamanashiensis]|uniref:Uncharacterized protein n=1 Tax=Spirilliplanes yamanashiensis TaxID=42233 RepID=A0A8J3Y841_9ACTN|nr:preprotein translocase YidC [Spirilliplanes yamanashiensis]MDP9817339.1 hypothetical protein [Spirilliplanes yamanashiensis]GIJ03010.1 hypothetical protein Sya03_23620 [Spirilliplanes yamanashiensis]
MTAEHGSGHEAVERGAAEDGADAPLTPREVAAGNRPPSAPGPDSDDEVTGGDGAGTAGGSSGGSGGGSGMPGHPDAAD